jgi:branched-chain amino acid aminotransferase
LKKDYNIPIDENLNAGKLAKRLADTIMGIQYGEIESEWSVVVK